MVVFYNAKCAVIKEDNGTYSFRDSWGEGPDDLTKDEMKLIVSSIQASLEDEDEDNV